MKAEIKGRFMKQASHPRNDSGRLSVAFSDLLNAYVLSASAAGVAILASSVFAEAEAVCVPLNNVVLLGSGTYQLFLSGEDVPAFNVAQTYSVSSHQTFGFWNRGFFTPNSVGASVVVSSNGFPADLSSRAVVGPGGEFGKGNSYGLLFTYGPSGGGTRNHHKGNFGAKVNYVGFKFMQAEQMHFGWARMRMTITSRRHSKYTSIRIDSYGFETTPNKPIEIGANCKKGDDPTAHIFPGEGGAGKPSSGPDVVTTWSTARPSLGVLALGAQGVALWRQK